ncbi:hypothetical protein LCGC14_2840550, partial [marine sediment metagenome]
MESKVVHMRIDLSTLIGCYDATLSAGGQLEGESTASIVSTVLKAGIKSMRVGGAIPTYPSEELLLIRARELLGEGDAEEINNGVIDGVLEQYVKDSEEIIETPGFFVAE